MKKLVLLLLAALVLAVAAVYYFIPSKLDVFQSVKLNLVTDAASRKLADEHNWSKWWPAGGVTAADGKSFNLSGYNYSISKKGHNYYEVLVTNNQNQVTSEIKLLAVPDNHTLITWQFSTVAGNNLFNRISAYRRAVSLKNDMKRILTNLQTYLSDFKNVYGFKFKEASTVDTSLISTKIVSAKKPGTEQVYALVDKLKKFCVTEGCTITGTPMLNVTRVDSTHYDVMVAIPVNKIMPSKDSVASKRMVPAKFFIAEITGGPGTIDQTHTEMQNYFRDYYRTAMAIPFEYMETDRRKETDTSKWVTRIYWPVF